MFWRRFGLILTTLSVLLGSCGLLIAERLPSNPWLFMMSAALICLFAALIRINAAFKTAVVPLCAALAALCSSAADMRSYIDCRLTESDAGREYLVIGRVVHVTGRDRHAVRFELQAERILTESRVGSCDSLRLRLAWYQQADTLPEIRSGQLYQLRVRLKPPHGYANPGGFDFERWLFTRDVHATGYVRRSSDNRLLEDDDPWLIRLREHINAHITRAVDHREAAILKALAIGDRRDITAVDWQLLIDTGTNHLIAISGLHIGLAAAFAASLVSIAGRRLLPLRSMLHCSVQDIAWIAGMLSALAYAALSGMGVPAQRALIMLCVFSSARLLRRHSRPLMSLAIAMLIVLLIEPRSVHLAGFWFSFMAVGIILLSIHLRLGGAQRWRQFIAIQLALSFGLMPMGLLLFQQSSLVAPLANLIMVPVVSLIVVPLVLLAILTVWLPWLCTALLTCAAKVMSALWHPLEWLAATGTPVVTSAMLLSSLSVGSDIEAGELSVDVLDVGQGTSVVLRTRSHTVVYDAGPSFGRHDAARSVIIPFLQYHGIDEIDTLLISHGDNDHIGGAASLIDRMTVHRLAGQQTVSLQHDHRTGCIAGQGWQYDNVHFELLSPPSDDRYRSDNDMSCVLKVTTSHGSVLLTGDIEDAAERALLAAYDGSGLEADILLVPHHGSDTSSSQAFVDAVDADYAVITAGYRNRYRLPAADVLRRYRETGSQVIITGHSGAVSFRITSEGGSAPARYRVDHPAPWRRKALY